MSTMIKVVFLPLLSLSHNKCVEICNVFILLRLKFYFDYEFRAFILFYFIRLSNKQKSGKNNKQLSFNI